MSWRNIAEQYYVRITELEARLKLERDSYAGVQRNLEKHIAKLEAEITRLSEALDGALAADWSSLRETLARQEEREALLRDIQAMREQYAPLEEGESVMLDTLQDHVGRRAGSTP